MTKFDEGDDNMMTYDFSCWADDNMVKQSHITATLTTWNSHRLHSTSTGEVNLGYQTSSR